MSIDKEILRRLRENDPELIRLDLSSKQLDDEDMQELCRALGANEHLVSLGLHNNCFSDDGIKSLVDVLQKNRVLKRLELYGNNLTWRSFLLLKRLLKSKAAGLEKLVIGEDDDDSAYDVNYEDKKLMAFWDALECDDVDTVDLFLAAGRNVNEVVDEEHGDRAISLAARDGSVNVMKRLLKEPGININAYGGDCCKTALQHAVKTGKEHIVDILLADIRIDVNARYDANIETALQVAAFHGQAKSVKKLLNAGINPFAVVYYPTWPEGYNKPRTALHYAIDSPLHDRCIEIVDMLIKIPGMDNVILDEDNDVLKYGGSYRGSWKVNLKSVEKIQAIRSIKKYLDELPDDSPLKPIRDKCLEVKSIALVMGEQLDNFIISLQKNLRICLLRAQTNLRTQSLVAKETEEKQPRKRLRSR
jgi:hypothetical protein